MERTLLLTADGSPTFYIPALNECYHSTRGAMSEALHVFIQEGFDYAIQRQNTGHVDILEIGFGTGLNAFLTAQKTEEKNITCYYESIEKYPLSQKEIASWPYASNTLWNAIHQSEWNTPVKINALFSLQKKQCDLQFYEADTMFDIIYFDAFAPTIQPELWTDSIFEKLYKSLKSGGFLVTYSSKGTVKQSLRAAGFVVQHLAGAMGKRHMLRAVKQNELERIFDVRNETSE